jgi:hypothetical protein
VREQGLENQLPHHLQQEMSGQQFDATPLMPGKLMPGKRRVSIRIVVFLAVAIALGGIYLLYFLRNRPVTLRGAVVRQSDDPNKMAPVAGVAIVATDGTLAAATKSATSGAFELTVRRTLIRRHSLTLSFRHPDYQPFNVLDPVGDQLYIAKMVPRQSKTVAAPETPTVRITNVSVRYTVQTQSTIDIGTGMKTFEVTNKGNVSCKGDPVCSPDGKWKAASTSASLDAGPDNEFRNGRVSCIAGPCPFTAIEHDGFSHGGRVIDVTVIDWSDTTTFLLQAEAVRRNLSQSIRKSYPVIFEGTMNFSLPASAQGTCIEAEIDGAPIVFPIGPNLSMSWADCETQTEPEDNRLYRCELKRGYAFR